MGRGHDRPVSQAELVDQSDDSGLVAAAFPIQTEKSIRGADQVQPRLRQNQLAGGHQRRHVSHAERRQRDRCSGH